MNLFSPDNCHDDLFNAPPALSFALHGREPDYRKKLFDALKAVLGDMPERVEPQIEIEYEKRKKGYTERRFSFLTEKDTRVPCHLLIPDAAKLPAPLAICLQGHSSGMHISLGKAKTIKEFCKIRRGDRDYALQAAERGYCALVMEQRCFGERKSEARLSYAERCLFASGNALLLGRTMLGERVWDVSRAIDAVAVMPEVDLSKIICLGNSGGGTVTYYAACMDGRIGIAIPSCSVCTYKGSIGSVRHCFCNYLPGAAKYFDMGDLAALIAPRALIVIAGKKDPLFPFAEVKKCFDNIRNIYANSGVPERCALLAGNGGHRFYENLCWGRLSFFL
jgi:dienelactone hydrolase